MSVMLASVVSRVMLSGALTCKKNCSLVSTLVSPNTEIVMVLLISPTAKLTVPELLT